MSRAVEVSGAGTKDRGRHPGVLPFLALLLLIACGACASCGDTAAAVRETVSWQGGATDPQVALRAAEWRSEVRADPQLFVCRIRITQIQLDVAVVEGTGPEDLERGPGHWRDTPYPGEGGRVVISGHRSSLGAPFLRLDELQPGARIELVLPYGTVGYEVTETLIVEPHQVEVVAQRGLEELSLATCHPPGSEEFRMIVQARAVDFTAAGD